MSGREEMLERIRKALGHPPRAPLGAPYQGASTPVSGVMPIIAPGEVLATFEGEWAQVGGIAHRAASLAELEQIIRAILEASQATRVVLSRNPLLGLLGLPERLRAWGKSVALWPLPGAAAGEDESAARREFASASFSAAVGITGVDFVLAETGSLVLTSRTEGSQLASLAPPMHVALYRRHQGVGSLDEVLERLSQSHGPHAPAPGRSAVFITGPSRTADIEQILVRGVHGPRDVHAILVEESCLAIP